MTYWMSSRVAARGVRRMRSGSSRMSFSTWSSCCGTLSGGGAGVLERDGLRDRFHGAGGSTAV
ncbi:MAG TPA: hypothetical protein VEB22_06970 [Phycisphaerales bacterium]|nr:hypothetical protein [Phycisphaerales bacterium]